MTIPPFGTIETIQQSRPFMMGTWVSDNTSYPYYSGTIDNWSPRQDVIWNNGTEIATPSNPPTSGNYSMCNC